MPMVRTVWRVAVAVCSLEVPARIFKIASEVCKLD
jgi:hypothetical protein